MYGEFFKTVYIRISKTVRDGETVKTDIVIQLTIFYNAFTSTINDFFRNGNKSCTLPSCE